MYPVLFHIGTIPVETYYVFWFTALSLTLLWTVGRLPLYGVDDDEGRRVISWSFMGMLVGARAFEYIWNFPVYWNNPALILDLNRGGLAEVGAISGAVVTAVALCWHNPKISFERLCDAGTPPTLFTMALGRWGCFFAGCCVGVPSPFRLAVRFPYDPVGVTRHPTQLYYSFVSAAILLLLLALEKRILRRGGRGGRAEGRKQPPQHALLAPLGLILYSAMRLSIDSFRVEGDGLSLSHWTLIAAMPFEVVWLTMSWRAFHKSTSNSSTPNLSTSSSNTSNSSPS
ncbi:MAG: prolipoprotein diacylglyceryl transferase [Synergistaceae bacterium]|jgi:phosphatidylglycerol:prolipoprotein diacylglycerol transferase|nr:prolipoprotein diacylglyceryl transferase [Synergistaceae bacterium]